MVTSISTDPTVIPSDFGEVDGVSPIYGFEGDYSFTGGTGDYLNLTHDDSLKLSAGTYSLMFNADSVAGRHTLFSKDAKGYGDGGHLIADIKDGKLRVFLDSDTADGKLAVNADVQAGTDYHFATSFGPDGLHIYLNGRLLKADDSLTFDMDMNEEDLVIGGNSAQRNDANPTDVFHLFDGTLGDFAVYDQQLSTDMIVELADAAGVGPTILGTNGNDTLSGTDDDDIILGNLGDDRIEGGKGADTLNGNGGIDGEDIDPSDLGDMLLWLDASDINGDGSSTTDGSAITTWADKSGNGYDATAVGTVNFDADGYNGHASMDIAESGYFELNADSFNEDAGTIITVFNAEGSQDIVFYAANSNGITSSPIFNGYGTTGHQSNTTEYFEFNVGLAQNLSYTYQNKLIHNKAFGEQLNTNTDHLSVVTYDKTTTMKAYEEGELTSTQDLSDSATFGLEVDTVMLGRHGSSVYDTHRNFSGDIAEVLVFNEVLSDINIDKVFRYLSDKYAVEVSPTVSDMDILTGGPGKDVFEFSNLQYSTDDAKDIIADFKPGKDVIDISDLGLTFSDLTVTAGGGTTVVADNNSDFAFELTGEFVLSSLDFIV